MKFAAVLAALLLAGCAVRQKQAWRVCREGPYTGDTLCGAPLPKKAALDAAKVGLRETRMRHFVEPNRDGNVPLVYRLNPNWSKFPAKGDASSKDWRLFQK